MNQAASQQADNESSEQEVYTYKDSSEFTQYLMRRTAASHADFFLPHLRPGMSLLDCGCGPGSITIDLAEIVAPGEVVGIDIDAGQFELGQARAAERGIANLRFETGDIYNLHFPKHSFDAVFVHGVLSNLQEPLRGLKEIRRVLKPGGAVGVRAGDVAGWLLAPPEPLLLQSIDFLARLHMHNGCDPQIGKQLRPLLREAGFSGVEATASYSSHGTSETTREVGEGMASLILGPTFAEVPKLGWADRETLERMNAAWKTWAEQPDSFLARTWVEAIGWVE